MFQPGHSLCGEVETSRYHTSESTSPSKCSRYPLVLRYYFFSLWWLLVESSDLSMKGWMFFICICVRARLSK